MHRGSWSKLEKLIIVASIASLVAIGAAACAPVPKVWTNTYTAGSEDAFLTDKDFLCVGDPRFTKVGKVRIWNALGHQDEAVAFAQSNKPGTFPVGTLIQLLPKEAMVKRGKGFSPDTGDWEYFTLGFNHGAAVITSRGPKEPTNLGGTCLSCHQAAKDYDYACLNNGTCKPLPFFINTTISPSDDPRCPAAG